MPGTNLIGPYGEGVNETYDTPDFGDSGGTQFSWYVDCSSDTANDGTRWTARWANRVMLQLRRAVIGMGIPINEVDGDSLYKAILRAHRPIVNIGGGANIHKGEKMPEWQHELRSLVGAGTVTVNVVGDTIVITGAGGGEGGSVMLQSVGAGVPVYRGVSGSIHQFRSLMAELGVEVAATTNEAVFRLAPQPGWSIMLRNAGSAGRPTGVAIDELTEITNPANGDWLMLQRASGRELRKVTRANLVGSQLWEIASSSTVSGTPNVIDLAFTADRYSKLLLAVENLRFSSAVGGTTDSFEVCVMRDSTLITRAPFLSQYPIPGDVAQSIQIHEVNGHIGWSLSPFENRSVRQVENTLHDLIQMDQTGNPPPQADPLVPSEFVLANVTGGAGKWPSAAAKTNAPNKVRLRHLNFTNIGADTYSASNFVAGRAILYGLTRGGL